MAARAMGSGVISFGLVSIPVKLFSSNQPQSGVSFNLLHGEDGARLKQQYLCSVDGKIVPREEMVKGYEFEKGRYVTFSNEELEALEAVGDESIAITEFVHARQVDPVYFDKAYWLGPDRGAARAYALLVAAMKETGRVALAKYAARGKQYLVMLRPTEGGLAMQQLRYADEVKPFSEVGVETADVSDRELQLAVNLIEQIASEKFQPDQYTDEVKERTLALIQRKVEGETITAPAPAEPGEGRVVDLMEALKASLTRAGKAPAAAAAPRAEEPAAERKPPRRAPSEAAPKKAAGGKRGKR
jgi:DNA end-binding protein Ku